MKLQRQFCPSLVAACKTDERKYTPNLIDLKLTRSGSVGYLHATNGRIGIIAEVDELTADDVEGMIPAEAVSAAEDGLEDNFTPTITAGKQDVVVDLSERPHSRTLIAKRYDVDLFPDLEGIVRTLRKKAVVATVSFDVKLLARLAKALGTDSVTLRLRDTSGNGLVEVATTWGDSDRVRAVLAPLRVDPEKMKPAKESSPPKDEADEETEPLPLPIEEH